MKVYRKHIFAYLGASLGAAFCVAAIYGVHAIDVSALIRNSPSLGPGVLATWANGVLYALFGLALARALYTFAILASVKIEIDERGVSYSFGFLPWASSSYHWRPFQLFSASCVKSGFFGWLFSYGSVVFTGREGVTKEVWATMIYRAKQCSIDANALLDDTEAQRR